MPVNSVFGSRFNNYSRPTGILVLVYSMYIVKYCCQMYEFIPIIRMFDYTKTVILAFIKLSKMKVHGHSPK